MDKTADDNEIDEEPSPARAQVQPDGGWGWLVCVSSMLTYGTVGSFINTFSILYVAMLDEYGKDDPNISSKTAQVGSMYLGLSCLMCPIASLASEKIGVRKTAVAGGIFATAGMVSSAFVPDLVLLYLTYGTVVGLGSGFVYGQSYAILGHYFKRRLGVVTGLYYFSSPAVTIALTLGLPPLLASVGLRYTLLVLSSLTFLWIPCCLLWKPLLPKVSPPEDPTSIEMLEDSKEVDIEMVKPKHSWKGLDLSIWRNRNYVLWLCSCAIIMTGYFVPLVHMVQFCKDVFPANQGSRLVMYLYIASGISRCVAGRLSDVAYIDQVRMNQMALLVLAACYVCLPFPRSFGGLIAVCVFIGVCDGCVFCLLGLLTVRIVGEKSASQGYGFLLGVMSVPLTIGPPLAGLLYDRLGSYNVAFHTAGAILIVGMLLQFFIRIRA